MLRQTDADNPQQSLTWDGPMLVYVIAHPEHDLFGLTSRDACGFTHVHKVVSITNQQPVPR